MKDLSFIWLKSTKEQAWRQNPFPSASLDYKGQIQLKPFDPQPYIQTTRSETDLELEDGYKVYLLHCNNYYELTSDHAQIFKHTDIYFITQLRIKLIYLPYDFGVDLVCLHILPNGGVPEVNKGYYSNPFFLSDFRIDLTTRIDYSYIFHGSQFETLTYNSIRLQMYPNNYVSGTEIDTYYQISKGQNVISRVSKDRRIQWCFENADEWHFKRLEEALYNSPCYFNQIRQYPVESLTYEERQLDSNFSENMVITDPNEDDFLNIVDEIPPTDLTVPMLASSSQLCSTSQLVSEIETIL